MINKKIAIIGAGITGLATAYELQKSGIEPDIFERKETPGGAVKSSENNEWQFEYGPNTLLLKDMEVEQFIHELGLNDRVAEANPDARKRFIVKNGELLPLEGSPVKMIRTSLFSARAKLRLLAEPFIPRTGEGSQSVADFFEKRFGRELLDYAINPFVAGIYAGRPEELSARHAFPVLKDLENDSGSVITGAIGNAFRNRRNKNRVRRRLISFKNGLAELPRRIESKLNSPVIHKEAVSVSSAASGWQVLAGDEAMGPYKKVIITVPLYRWNDKLLPINETQLERVHAVNYPPLSVIILAFKKEDVNHPLDGFGFLVPEAENRKILGALFTSALFEGRAPEGHHLLTVFVGGGRQPDLAVLQGEEMFDMVMGELNELIGLNGEPVFKEHVFWPHSIPQYDLQHQSLLDLFDDLEEDNPDLHFAGNFRGGISVPDCIKNAIKLGKELSSGD